MGTVQDAFALLKAGALAEAEAAFRRVVATGAGDPLALHGLSQALKGIGDIREAVDVARRAAALSPEHPGLHYSLGLLQQDLGALDDATLSFSAAARLKPDFHQAWLNLGVVSEELGRREDAKNAYRGALTANPNYAAALNNLGCLHLAANEYAQAEPFFRQLFCRAPHDREIRQRLIRALLGARRLDEACELLEARLASHPDDAQALFLLARTRADMNEMAVARAHFARLAELDAGDWRGQIGSRLALPAIPASAGEIALLRQGLAEGLTQLTALADTDLGTDAQRLAGTDWVNFFLAYHGEDDRELQGAHAAFVRRLVLPVCGDLPAPARTREQGDRIRVGFASAFFRECTVGNYFRSWITGLPSERFETFVYLLGGVEDELTRELTAAAAIARVCTGPVPESARTILDDGLDILIYPELGMHGPTYALASLRLAPIQCAAWGHPVTSGHETIDFFLSSAIMEPSDGDAHYRESLVRLPGLGTCYRRPPVAGTMRRADFGLPEEANLYLFPHALFKIHPDNDRLLARLLAADPRGLAVLFEGESRWMTEAFMRRLTPTLGAHGVSADRVRLQPLMPRQAYLEINARCDVMVDCERWSGGNTTLDALAVGLPVVTRAGRFMRGRQSCGMLSAMGLEEWIAADEDALLALALKLASDQAGRGERAARIRQAWPRLFDDPAPILALQAFLEAQAATS